MTQGPVRYSELPAYSQAVTQTTVEMTSFNNPSLPPPTNINDNGNFS